MKKELGIAVGFSALVAVVFGTACDPVPRRTLSAEDKVADLYWMYSQFNENYAPLEYKENRYQFKFDKLKQDYLEAAKQTKTNDEFYDLMFKLVAEFKDAHTSAALTNSSMPDRAKVAFLGFSGIRHGDSLLVKSLLPTILKDSPYPIKVGDVITKINGILLKDYITQNLLKYRNLGNDESNYTYHMNKIFTRISTANGLPSDAEAMLTVVRSDKTLEIRLPWVTKDLSQFQNEQAAAKDKLDKSKKQTSPVDPNDYLSVLDDHGQSMMFNFIGFDGRIQYPWETLRKLASTVKKHFMNGFQFVDNVSEWTAISAASGEKVAPKNPIEVLAENRPLPSRYLAISSAKTFPAYITAEKMIDKDGKAMKQQTLIGYIYLDTFSPSASESDVIKEFKATLAEFKTAGVKNLVIDTINNGGGSLTLGMKLAQLLSPTKIEMPGIQVKLSDSWFDQFYSQMKSPQSDAEGAEVQTIYNGMLQAQKDGKRLSQTFSAEKLASFEIVPNTDLDENFNTILLVNEMCASMCDIFAGILQDNKLATILGTRTMGAGGNVVNYQQAPNSHLDLRQTESLMVRKDGSLIENNGVTPDVALSVVSSAKDKYSDAIKKAFEIFTKAP